MRPGFPVVHVGMCREGQVVVGRKSPRIGRDAGRREQFHFPGQKHRPKFSFPRTKKAQTAAAFTEFNQDTNVPTFSLLTGTTTCPTSHFAVTPSRPLFPFSTHTSKSGSSLEMKAVHALQPLLRPSCYKYALPHPAPHPSRPSSSPRRVSSPVHFLTICLSPGGGGGGALGSLGFQMTS